MLRAWAPALLLAVACAHAPPPPSAPLLVTIRFVESDYWRFPIVYSVHVHEDGVVRWGGGDPKRVKVSSARQKRIGPEALARIGAALKTLQSVADGEHGICLDGWTLQIVETRRSISSDCDYDQRIVLAFDQIEAAAGVEDWVTPYRQRREEDEEDRKRRQTR